MQIRVRKFQLEGTVGTRSKLTKIFKNRSSSVLVTFQCDSIVTLLKLLRVTTCFITKNLLFPPVLMIALLHHFYLKMQ